MTDTCRNRLRFCIAAGVGDFTASRLGGISLGSLTGGGGGGAFITGGTGGAGATWEVFGAIRETLTWMLFVFGNVGVRVDAIAAA